MISVVMSIQEYYKYKKPSNNNRKFRRINF